MDETAPLRAEQISAEQTAAIARALAEPRRFAIFEQIAGCTEMPCSALAVHSYITAATISHHIKELTDAGLIEVVRDGRTLRLSVCRPTWNAYLQRLQSL